MQPRSTVRVHPQPGVELLPTRGRRVVVGMRGNPILRITVPSRLLRRWLLGLALLAVLASAVAVTLETLTHPDDGIIHRATQFAGFWLDVNNERNLPAWYSTVLLAVVALVASDVARVERSFRLSPWWSWAFLSATFLYLSLDELIQMHEGSSIVSALLLPLVIVFALATAPLLWKLPRRIAYQVAAAGVIFVGGSAGMEFIGQLPAGSNQVLVHLEEAAEMIGVAIILAAIAQYREVLDERLLARSPAGDIRLLPG
ncbi:hypothetical protein ACPW96_06010 [Micromonospora sp. DT81.3]|uniref:hypothetical protein n=1 Tax=Micromonospora sp. DT81.3 TaxID=3416523 RepID=UPI003CF8A264